MRRRNGHRKAVCTIYEHVSAGGPLCDCGSLIAKTEGDTQTIAIKPDALLELLKETSEEFREWLEAEEVTDA